MLNSYNTGTYAVCTMSLYILINDNVAEDRYENLYYYIGVYNKNMPYQRSSGRIRIEDDEGMLSKNV